MPKKIVKENYQFTKDDFIKMSRNLEKRHALFYQFWEVGAPHFSKSIPTACVTFDKDGHNTGFLFNPDFWNKCDDYTKTFIVAHEMLHVVLNHGVRCRDAAQRQICNVALDLVVNHTLCKRFNFDRKKVKVEKDLCWVDTVFKDEKVSADEGFEFYYNKIVEDIKSGKIKAKAVRGGGGSGGNNPFEEYDLPETLDDHEMMGEEDLEKIVDELNELVSDRDKQSIKDIIDKHYSGDKEKEGDKPGGRQAGTGTGGWTFISDFRTEKKKKWETIIHKWANRYIKHDVKEAEQWAREHRRISEFKRNLGEDIFLPSEVDMEDFLEDTYKITVFFFLDTSGSCWDLKDRFFEAAASLPEDKFDVRLFCFDTQVKETTLASKQVYGGGGTDFVIIEDHIQAVIKKEGLEYPKAVFLITDGYGTPVSPKHPGNWYWFLSHDYRSCIPKESNIYRLCDFE